MPKVNNSAIFTQQFKGFYQSNRKISRNAISEVKKSGGVFDEKIDSLIDDFDFLLQMPSVVEDLFANNRERYLKFGKLLDRIRLFDELDPPENYVLDLHKLQYYNRIPQYRITNVKNGKYVMQRIIFSKNEIKRIANGTVNFEFFFSIIKKGSKISLKNLNFLRKSFEYQKETKAFYFIIPLKENKQYTWKQIVREFKKRKLILDEKRIKS